MYALEWTPRSLDDLERLQRFLQEKNPRAADAAIDDLIAAAYELCEFPHIGRLLSDDEPEFRELPVAFSNSGYVILYRFDGAIIEIQAIKHMREDDV